MATRTDMPLTSVRNRMRQLVRKNLPGPAGGLVQAVTLGVRDEIAPHWAAAFLRTGNGHLLAVSGLHAGVVCAVAFMLAALLGLSIWEDGSSRPCSPSHFSLLIGFNPPSVRATLMVFAALASVFAGRPHNSLNSLALAILVILAIQPHALFEPSLQLSASAICGILILGLPLADTVPKTTILDRWPKRYRLFLLRITAVSLGAWAFTNPLAAFHFGQVNPFAFLYALVAVPLLAALVCSSFLMLLSALVTGGAFAVAIPAQACAWLLALLNRLLELVPLGCSFMRPLSLGLAIALMLLLVAGSLAISLRRMNLALALFALGGVLSLFALYNPAKSGARELDSRYGRSLLAVWQDEHLVVFDHAARSYTRLRYLCAKNSLPPPSAVVRLRPVSALQDRRFPVPLLLPVSFAPASNAYSAGTVVEVGKMRAVALAPRRYPAGMLLARPQLAVGAWTVYLSGD
ncbi:MAG: ComEC/Rec2 family competence protein [Planctomycetota bacterium]|nr:ComEC/Rec2 family competence protein [Planctomycetota bacterium]